jgi:dTMP kinase
MAAKFIVIEGTDGSGKTKQTRLLVSRIHAEITRIGACEKNPRSSALHLRQSASTTKVVEFDFPQYGKPSAYFVEQYLNGVYGTAEEVGPHRASLFYALDRYEASFELRRALEEGKTVVSNRYVGSNLAHQGGKFKSKEERKKFFEWEYKLEYETLGIPKPDISIVLHMPAAMAQELVGKKSSREYLNGKTHDLHEVDLNHLKNAEEAYLELVRAFPSDFRLVECVEGGRLLSIEEVHERVWDVVKGFQSSEV